MVLSQQQIKKIESTLGSGLSGFVAKSELQNGHLKTEFHLDLGHGDQTVRGSVSLRPPKEIHLGGIYVNDLPGKKLQGMGIGKKVLQNILAIAGMYNIPEISLVSTEVESYVWARAGFVPGGGRWRHLKKEISKTLDALEMDDDVKHDLLNFLEKSTDPNDIRVIADSKYGKDLLVNTGYPATLNLKDTDTMARFKAYTDISQSQQRTLVDLVIPPNIGCTGVRL